MVRVRSIDCCSQRTDPRRRVSMGHSEPRPLGLSMTNTGLALQRREPIENARPTTTAEQCRHSARRAPARPHCSLERSSAPLSVLALPHGSEAITGVHADSSNWVLLCMQLDSAAATSMQHSLFSWRFSLAWALPRRQEQRQEHYGRERDIFSHLYPEPFLPWPG